MCPETGSPETGSPETGSPERLNFDIQGRLPAPGVTILEASAGTGKTFTIAALVARLVAEGVAPLSEILVVTFTRMATGQLRERVHARLASAERALGSLIDAGELPGPGDEVLQVLATAVDGTDPREVLQERRRRLARALANFDSATITTTHGFCHMVLAALGAWGEVAPGAALLEDPGDLVRDTIDDLYARHVLSRWTCPFSRSEALDIGLRAVNSPGTLLGPPADRADQTPYGLRRRLADAARLEVARRFVDANLLSYDDLMVRLEKALSDPVRGQMACTRLRDHYSVVLVDEFQDTDLVQWGILRQAFADGTTRLVLIGDPKQAIYAFRGADVHAYLEAARVAPPEHRFTLDENWRSDAGLLLAHHALLAPLHLGHPEIVLRQAKVAPAHQSPGLVGAPVTAPLRARLVERTTRGLSHIGSGLVQKDAALKWVADDLAADVVALLKSRAKLARYGPGGRAVPPSRPVAPQDIGVLVRTNRQAATVQASLRAVGVPVVVAGAQSVLSTPAARDWLRLLEALEQPTSRSLAVAVALTGFIGMGPEQLASADEGTWETLHGRLHEWAALERSGGVATLFGHISAHDHLSERLLAQIDGERLLTDLGHVAEVLHSEATRSQLGLSALRAWLGRHIEQAGAEGGEAEQRSRRLDSGSAAVQVLTIHRSKGLEFPVVYCPYLWDGAQRDHRGGPVVYHDLDDGGRRKLDVGGEIGDKLYEAHFLTSQAERRGEDLRHLYVALTRAKHQVVLWWAPAKNCHQSALGRVLFCKDANGDVASGDKIREPKDADVRAALEKVAARARSLAVGEDRDLVSVERATGRTDERWTAPSPVGSGDDLGVATFGRELDLDWRRLSYTSIASPADARRWSADPVASEPEDPGITDEPPSSLSLVPSLPIAAIAPELGRSGATVAQAGEERLRAHTSLLASIPGGSEVGTFVHRVLEEVDFAAPDLPGSLRAALGAGLNRYPGAPSDLDVLATGLEAAIETPLGPLVGGMRLRDLGRRDRLNELRFELPLSGGDKPVGDAVTADLARIFARHVAPGEPLGSYATALAAPELAVHLRGYLTGSLDLVLRTRDGGDTERYFVADYKTNRLGVPGTELSAWDYRPEALETEMCAANYALQALLYLVALHRYLRWRLPGYHPATHLGGALYLFVRGMMGSVTPATAGGERCGVFSWSPPAALVTEVSDLLAGLTGLR